MIMKSKKIAITGGIGSGKSLVIDIIKKYKFPVFSCDEIYRRIIQTPTYVQTIARLFPSVVIENRIDKQALANIVFSDETARERLNAVAHPLILEWLQRDMAAAESALVFAEVPLLFESQWENFFDETWVILRNKQLRISAITTRDRCTDEEALRRIQTQFDYDSENAVGYFQKLNAVIFTNDGSTTDLEKQIISKIQSYP